MGTVPTITLNNGVLIPQLGYGTYKVAPADAFEAVSQALQVGYRHLDTAEMYGNEREVGQAVRESGIPRDEVFITSKLNNGLHERDKALRSFDGTLAALGVDQIDLFLIHWPLPAVDHYVEAWRTFEEIYAQGGARAIGVSNFNAHHLQRLFDECEVVPAVNQIEVHPFCAQPELRAFNAEHGIATEAWAPIARGRVLEDPVIVGIAESLDRTPSQVALRWAIQRGDIVFPKTMSAERMRENFDVFDFEISGEAMAQIDGLDSFARTGPDPDAFNWIP